MLLQKNASLWQRRDLAVHGSKARIPFSILHIYGFNAKIERLKAALERPT